MQKPFLHFLINALKFNIKQNNKIFVLNVKYFHICLTQKINSLQSITKLNVKLIHFRIFFCIFKNIKVGV